MAHSASWDAELNVPAKQIWKAFENCANIFPKLMPKHFKSIEVLEGDGINHGSVRLIKYGEGFQMATYKLEKIESLDEANMTTTHSVLSGEIMHKYKTYKLTLKVSPGVRSGTCVVKWVIEYEPAHEGEVVHPENAKETAVHTFKVLEEYLLSNPLPVT
ncbi:MLP-like protein 423 isoform X2 [Cryptomeria japonica]|uniref:MLP-like protein 423 isoform X2 n=1 Tax=Cryptomeria japonica TaxID=3369 RepID=UPI0027D9DEA2|nr:MLP-like protein 423 isoform X2 [Cryptomeria japonica]